MHRPGRGFLNNPGPTNIPERVLAAMNRQALDLVDEELEDIVARCFAGLRPIFGIGEGELFLYAANGHGGWEAAITNVLDEGDKVLVPATGHFSIGWAETAGVFGVEAETLEGDLRRSFDMNRLEDRLRADSTHAIKAVMLVHVDTSTGIRHDVAAARAALDAAGHPALLMLDSVAALATTDTQMAAWGVDVCVSASQKGLMCPPGLAVIATSPKAMAAHHAGSRPRRYWDWSTRSSSIGYRTFCGTTPEHLMFALDESLRLIAEESLPAIYRRHAVLAAGVHAAVDRWAEAGGLENHAVVPADRSTGVTAIRTAEGIDPDAIRTTARRHWRTSIAGGLGPLRNGAFRIGHMGDMNEPMILGALAGVEATLGELHVPHARGGVEAALAAMLAAKAETASADRERAA